MPSARACLPQAQPHSRAGSRSAAAPRAWPPPRRAPREGRAGGGCSLRSTGSYASAMACSDRRKFLVKCFQDVSEPSGATSAAVLANRASSEQGPSSLCVFLKQLPVLEKSGEVRRASGAVESSAARAVAEHSVVQAVVQLGEAGAKQGNVSDMQLECCVWLRPCFTRCAPAAAPGRGAPRRGDAARQP